MNKEEIKLLRVFRISIYLHSAFEEMEFIEDENFKPIKKQSKHLFNKMGGVKKMFDSDLTTPIIEVHDYLINRVFSKGLDDVVGLGNILKQIEEGLIELPENVLNGMNKDKYIFIKKENDIKQEINGCCCDSICKHC